MFICRLFSSAREATVFLEVPRLRDSAVKLLEIYCQKYLSVDSIDDDLFYCNNCGGNCGFDIEDGEIDEDFIEIRKHHLTHHHRLSFNPSLSHSSRYDHIPNQQMQTRRRLHSSSSENVR